MKGIIDLIRAIPRPAMAIIAVGGTLILLLCHVAIPDAWWVVVASATTFYFVQRHDEKKNGGAS